MLTMRMVRKLEIAQKTECAIKNNTKGAYIEEEQTTQWPKEKIQKGKQRSTKHIYKTKDRVT
jgi:myo-inositol-hexaphosphate 3-phosphohydrolase